MRSLALLFAMAITLSIQASELITGAGSTFIAPVFHKWSALYNQETEVKVNYQSIGSGAGLKQIEGKTVDFGASDMPLSPAELKAKNLFQFPAIIGGIVMVVNIDQISHGKIILNAKTIAEIYTGSIKKWNDKRIQVLNPDLKLPNKHVTVIYRSDASGTTFNFTHYLTKAAEGVWTAGSGTAVSWPRGATGFGGKGNEGVTAMVKRVPGSIGYVEYAYALQNKMAWVKLLNAEGKIVPTVRDSELSDHKKVSDSFQKSFQAAAENANWKEAQGLHILLANQKGAETWPITASTFIIMHNAQEDSKKAHEVLKFFDFAYKKGNKVAESLNYIPIPAKTYDYIQEKWKSEIYSITDKKPIWK